MSEQETTYTVYCLSAEGKIKVIPNLKSQEEANRVAHHEIDTGDWGLAFSLDDKEKESYYSPADEITRLQARIERLEAQVRVAKTMRESAELHRDMERKNVSTLIKTLRKAHVDVPNLLYSNEADKAWGWYMQRLERLEAALRFYADNESYKCDSFLGIPMIEADKGDIARLALESEDSE